MSRRTTLTSQPVPRLSMGTAFLYGAGIGLVGAAVMTLSQKLEQTMTSRPTSFVPGRTLERVFGLRARTDNELVTLNWAMHYGLGALAGGVRGVMSLWGIRGPVADFMFAGLRLATDQTLENATGVGALPWLRGRKEKVEEEEEEEEEEKRTGETRGQRGLTDGMGWGMNRTWPVNEQIIDLIHKNIYAFFTGYFVDRLVQ
ncbi:MAG: hypothetical protein M1816_000153 [Peltula sp. TS41687]|nr:MAG: hypothetical protein M1816_000153 [Peltula sp. TS41687]